MWTWLMSDHPVLFYKTGLIIWSTFFTVLGIMIPISTGWVVYELIGASIMVFRVLCAMWRAGKSWGPNPVWEIIKFWWCLAFIFHNRGTFKMGVMGDVKWPRPWYRKNDDNP